MNKLFFSILLIILVIITNLNVSTDFILDNYSNNENLNIMHGKQLRTGISMSKLYNVKIAVIDSGYKQENNLDINLLNNNKSDSSLPHGLIVSNFLGSKPITNKFSGIFPGITLYYYNIPSDNLNSESLTKAISDVSSNNVDIINICLSTQEYSNSMEDAVKKAVEKGIVVVASSGNDGSDNDEYPASFNVQGLISVGAVDKNLNIPEYVTVNSNIDVYALGENINSLDPESGEIKQFSGTSMSTPFVTAAVALLKAKSPYLTPSQIETKIKKSSDSFLVNWDFENKVINLLSFDKLINQ